MKSSLEMTFRTDYFEGLHYLRKLMPEVINSTMVIYDGDQQSDQPIDGIVNFRNL